MKLRALARPVRIGLWAVAALLIVVIAGGLIFALSFNPESLKPRIVAAVKQQTGRDLTLQGPIRLGLSLQPTLVVQDVSFANPPGFSRPQMATLQELDLKLALIPLLSHRVEINKLVLVKPDVMLETDSQGHANWQFKRDAHSSLPQATSPGSSQEGTRTRVSIEQVQVQDGTVAWHDGRTGKTTVIGLKSLKANASSPDANLHLAATASYNGAPFTVEGDLGPLSRLEQPDATSPWPIQVKFEASGAKLVAEGTMTEPLQGRGYALKLSANVPDVTALSPFLPGQSLPPLHEVTLAARIADSGGDKLPEISALTLHVGPSDLTQLAALKLEKLDVSAPRIDQPMKVAAQGSFDETPLSLAGSLGAPSVFLPGAKPGTPIPIDVTLQALGSSVAIKGTTAPTQDGRHSIQAEIASNQIDVDRLIAALRKQRPASPPSNAAPSAPPPPKPASNGYVIPDTPIPFSLLRLADADVKLNVAELKSGGATYRAISTHIDLRGGKLRLDPFAADLPEGHLDAALTADATQTPQPVSLRLKAPALAAQPLLAAAGEPNLMSGTLQVQADVHGAGATPHAIASTLDGTLGLTMSGGTVDNRLLGGALGSILREVNLLDLVGRGGTSQVQCFAARLEANHGVAAVRPLLLSSSLLTMDGEGTLNLANETLDLRVRPQGRLGGNVVVVPLRVTGSLRSPAVAPDPTGAVTQNAGNIAGAVLGNATPLGAIAGVLGGQKLLGAAGTPDCASALAAARGQAPPPQQPSRAAQPPASQPKAPDIGGALKQLFR